MLQSRKNVLLVFGGTTAEYIESCGMAAAVLNVISKEKYNVYCMGISKEGEWMLTSASSNEIADSELWLKKGNNKRAIISPDKTQKGILILEDGKYDFISIDVAFPVIPGELGEDGKLPGLFEMAGIPYVGSNLCASACSLDKIITMMFVDSCNIKRPKFFTCNKNDFISNEKKVINDCIAFFNAKIGYAFPLMVKPVTGGSSIGLSKVYDENELLQAIKKAVEYSDRVIIEETIESSDLKVGVLEMKDSILIGDICEIVLEKNDFFSREKKENGALIKRCIPAPLSPEKEALVRQYALDIYKKIGCKGYARVDFLLKKNGEIYFNEINTSPDIRPHSAAYPHMFERQGFVFEDIVDILIKTALENN